MNYNNESLRNALAAEYVLGTLRGGARKRFKQLMLSNQTVCETVWMWEQYLNGMAAQIKPVAPDEQVWKKIEARLGFTSNAASITPSLAPQPKASLINWMLLAASIVMTILFVQIQLKPDPAPVTQFAVINDESAVPLWLIEISEDTLLVRPTDKLEQLVNQDYELWIVPANGSAPISLGLLPQSDELRKIAPEILQTIAFNALAVSLEPLGGSPSGQPTEVLFITNINNV